MKKLEVNKDLCIGCGACVAIDEEHFDFDEEGKSSVKSQENLEKESINDAINACPTQAISINEEA